MAVPGGQRRQPGPGMLARLVVLACTGIAAFVVIALFSAHGQAHDFAVGAAFAGVGAAVLGTLVRWLVRAPWGDIVTLAVLASFWDDVTGRRR